MRSNLVLVVALTSGCSLIAIEKLPSGYKGKTEPRCDTSSWPIYFDGLTVIGDAVTVGLAKDTTVQLAAIVDGLIWGASAIAGLQWTGECQEARDRWDADEINRRRDQERRDERARDLERERLDEERQEREEERRELRQLRRELERQKHRDDEDEPAPADAGTPDDGEK